MTPLPAARRLAQGIQATVLLVLVLLAYGWTLAPSAVPIAAATVLLAYALFAHVSMAVARESSPRIQWVTLACGVLSGAVLIRALVVQYFGRAASNALMVTVVFAMWLAAGVAATARTRRIRDAVVASTLSAQIGSLANVGVILASYYVLRGSALQEQFFRIEGTHEDFVRNGVGDFETFVIGDLFGAAFFHLLFGALFGALLGTIGGTLTVGVGRMLTRYGIGLPNTLEPTAEKPGGSVATR